MCGELSYDVLLLPRMCASRWPEAVAGPAVAGLGDSKDASILACPEVARVAIPRLGGQTRRQRIASISVEISCSKNREDFFARARRSSQRILTIPNREFSAQMCLQEHAVNALRMLGESPRPRRLPQACVQEDPTSRPSRVAG